LDQLAKLQGVSVSGSHRSIFDFGQAPAPKVDPAKLAQNGAKIPSPLVPPPPADQAAVEPVKPPPPRIPLKFYGYVSPASQPKKRAFFMEGEEIHVALEGETIKKRYKIVRIGVNSAVVEDTQSGDQQTLPLEEQPG
jgi:hypothetical protein